VERIESDRAAIDSLLQRDIAAAKAYDRERLSSVLTEDVMSLSPGVRATMGAVRLAAALRRDSPAAQRTKPCSASRTGGNRRWLAITPSSRDFFTLPSVPDRRVM
jgi:hypothetical protein